MAANRRTKQIGTGYGQKKQKEKKQIIEFERRLKMIAGRLICEKCGKDFTNGLWGFILGVGPGRTINPTQRRQLEEFKKEFGKEQMIWCWGCTAKMFGAQTLAEKEAEEIPIEQQDKNKSELKVKEVPIGDEKKNKTEIPVEGDEEI